MDTSSDSPSMIGPGAVTDRQREVARLIAADRTNRQIADELGITLDGAKYHVSELLVRLGLERREEVRAWYRAHFGWQARMRGALALPGLGSLSTGAAVAVASGAAVVVIVVAVVVSGQVRSLGVTHAEVDEYPPFTMEMTVMESGELTSIEVLNWDSHADWELQILDAERVLLAERRSEMYDDGSRHIPGFWFLPINSWRGNPNAGYAMVSDYVWEFVYLRSCTELSNPEEGREHLPPTFCESPSDMFEDRTVAEFDPVTEIPVAHLQYIDGMLVSERRAVELVLK